MVFYASFLSANGAALLMVTTQQSSYLARNGNGIFQLQLHVPGSCSCVRFGDGRNAFSPAQFYLCWLYLLCSRVGITAPRFDAKLPMQWWNACASNEKTNTSEVNSSRLVKKTRASGWQMGRPLLFIHRTQRDSLSHTNWMALRTQGNAHWLHNMMRWYIIELILLVK